MGLNSFPRTWRKNNYSVSKEAIADVITANVWTCEAGSSDELDKKTFTRWVAYSMGSAVVTSHPFRRAGSVPLDVGFGCLPKLGSHHLGCLLTVLGNLLENSRAKEAGCKTWLRHLLRHSGQEHKRLCLSEPQFSHLYMGITIAPYLLAIW